MGRISYATVGIKQAHIILTCAWEDKASSDPPLLMIVSLTEITP